MHPEVRLGEEGSRSVVAAKGEFEPDEDPLDAAKREFTEETGFPIEGAFRALTPLRPPSGKTIHAWRWKATAIRRRCAATRSRWRWPPNRATAQRVPGSGSCGLFSLDEARKRIIAGQAPFLDQLTHSLSARE